MSDFRWLYSETENPTFRICMKCGRAYRIHENDGPFHYLEFRDLTYNQLDYLHSFGTFKNLYGDGDVYRLYGDPQNLYTALLLISKKYSIEILAQ